MAQESLVPYNAVHNEKRVRNTAWLFFRFFYRTTEQESKSQGG